MGKLVERSVCMVPASIRTCWEELLHTFQLPLIKCNHYSSVVPVYFNLCKPAATILYRKKPANFRGPFHSTWHQCDLSVHLTSLLFIAAANVACERPLGSRRGAELSCSRDSSWTIGRDQFTYLGRGKDAENTLRGWATLCEEAECQDSCTSKPSTMDRVTGQKRHSPDSATMECLH